MPILPKPPKSAKWDTDFRKCRWTRIVNQTPRPLYSWTSGLNCTTNNINSNSSTTNTKCTLTSTFSKYSTLLLLNVFPMLLAVCCTCHRVLLSIVSAGKAEGVGKGRAMRSGRPAAPKKRPTPRKEKAQNNSAPFRIQDFACWILEFGCWILDVGLSITYMFECLSCEWP